MIIINFVFLPWWNLCITLSQKHELCLTISLADFLYFWQFDQIFQKYHLPLGIWQLCVCKVAQGQYANKVRNPTSHSQRSMPEKDLNKDRPKYLYSEMHIISNELGLLVTCKSRLLVRWLCNYFIFVILNFSVKVT